MDTRLKNNKKALHTAVIIVALAAACFAGIALNYKERIDDYYTQYGSDFESEAFIEVLFQSNYVLYPEILEKCGKDYRIEDLYLSFEEEAIPEVDIDKYYGTELLYEGSSEQLKAEYVTELHNNILRTNSLYTAELGVKMDYCIIDEDTQIVLKNTTRDIELLRDRESGEYVYYFIIRYDKNGSISDISVSGIDAEQFLKNAQFVANGTGALLFEEKQRVTSYVLQNETDMVDRRMTVTQENPRSVTFIYAMTKQQRDTFQWFTIYKYEDGGGATAAYHIGSSNREMMYDTIGVGRLYLIVLGIITGIIGILTRHMTQRTADTAGTKHSVELIFVIQWILAIVLYSAVVSLVYGVNEVYSITTQINFVILFGVMFVLFGAWYWCILSVRDIFIKPRVFIRQRSLLYRSWRKFRGFVRKIRDKWKSDLAGVDLGKDMTKLLKKLVILQYVIISLICCFWGYGIFIMAGYSIVLYFGLKRRIGKMQIQYKNLLRATNEIAQGKFDNAFEGDFGIFESYKEELYQIQGGFRTAVEEEVKSQRMKTELITNVSHDLKTPLTAIITYIDLLKEENVTNEQKKSYLETLERKSLRLKVLIEDLFEISKASSGNVKFELVAVDICNLMRQVYLEHEDKMTENGLELRFDLPEEKIILQLDSQKTYRIFENLYVNITKYALPNTRVYVQAKVIVEEKMIKAYNEKISNEMIPARKIHIELKNISAQELTVNPTDLTERFVRGDASRNTEGSGLGLAIAKSFTELQGGRFDIVIDGDLFKAVIEWEL